MQTCSAHPRTGSLGTSSCADGVPELVERVERLRETIGQRRADRAGGHWTAPETSSPVTLALHGEVSLHALPGLDLLLDRVIGLGIDYLRVDLTGASSGEGDALDAIWSREGELGRLEICGEPTSTRSLQGATGSPTS